MSNFLELLKEWLPSLSSLGIFALFLYYTKVMRDIYKSSIKLKDEQIDFLKDQIKSQKPPSFIHEQMQVVKRLAEDEIAHLALINVEQKKRLEEFRSFSLGEKEQLVRKKKDLEAEISGLRQLLNESEVLEKGRTVQEEGLSLLGRVQRKSLRVMREKKRNVIAVVLAAGEGTRMRSTLSKLLHLRPLSSQALVRFAVNACVESGIERTVVVVGHQAEEVKSTLGEGFEYVYQEKRLGTGDALKQAVSLLRDFKGELVVVPGDAPFITSSMLIELIEHHRETKPAATVLTALLPDPSYYGRIIKDRYGRIKRIVENEDANAKELEIKEVNSGIYCFDTQQILPLLSSLDPHTGSGHFYLTDVFALLHRQGSKVEALRAQEPMTVLTVNTPEELKRAWRILGSEYTKLGG